MPSNDRPTDAACSSSKTYSAAETFLANLPYAFLLLLGAAVLAVGLSDPLWRSLAGLGYIAYGIVGSLWIMLFLCPFCHFYATRQCPCGYGQFSARLVRKRDGSRFAEKFRKHIPFIVPLWIIPPAAGGFLLARDFSWPLLVLLVLFSANSFVILPLVSRKNCCTQCPQKDICPWMGKRQPARS